MTTRSIDVQHGGWARWLFVGAGAVGHLGATGCLVPDTDYCAFLYGDLSCPAEQSFCVLAKEPTAHTNIIDGCSATVPEGFVHVHYGLPQSVAAPAERPDDPRSLEGMLAHLGYDGCGSADELEASLGPAVAGVAEVRRHLEERGHTRRATMALESDHVGAIEAFDAVVTMWIDECTMQGGTGSSGSSVESSADPLATTGDVPCTSHDACPEASPICDPVTSQCVTCDAAVDPDTACAELDPERPACSHGFCVECTASVTSACTGIEPMCDVDSKTCIPCTRHDQCGEAACNFFTGACLPADAVVHAGPGLRFPTLTSAVASVEPGIEATIVVHTNDYDESVTVEEGQVLAFLAAGVGSDLEAPRWTNTRGTLPQLTVSPKATVIMDGMWLRDNLFSSEPGLRIDGGRAWVDRSRVVANQGGGIAVRDDGALTLRNSFVGGNISNRSALEVSDASASVVYTTLGAGNGTAWALKCSGESVVTVRNTLLLAVTTEDEVDCPGATIEDSVSELDLGVTNVGLGSMSVLWFVGYANGDFHLSAAHPLAIATAADWRAEDPSTDIDGDPRPTEDNTIDYAGADVP